MPWYLGDCHHASTSLIWASYSSSSAAPAFLDSGSNWKASLGGEPEENGFAGAWAILGVVEIQRRAMAEVEVGRGRGTLRETARAAALLIIVALVL